MQAEMALQSAQRRMSIAEAEQEETTAQKERKREMQKELSTRVRVKTLKRQMSTEALEFAQKRLQGQAKRDLLQSAAVNRLTARTASIDESDGEDSEKERTEMLNDQLLQVVSMTEEQAQADPGTLNDLLEYSKIAK